VRGSSKRRGWWQTKIPYWAPSFAAAHAESAASTVGARPILANWYQPEARR
jgi:hypothetical protein